MAKILEPIVLAELRKRSPYAQCQFVDVTFNTTANLDTDIVHDLVTDDPYAVKWQVMQVKLASAPAVAPVIYEDTAATRRSWGNGYVVLRCNVGSVVARLLLYLER